MSSVKRHMSNRAVSALNVNIFDCLENINTWSVTLHKLINIKRKLLRKKTDDDIYKAVEQFMKLYYESDTDGNDSDSDSRSKSSNSGSDSRSNSGSESNNESTNSDNESSNKSSSSGSESSRSDESNKLSKSRKPKTKPKTKSNTNTHKPIYNNTPKTMQELALDMLAKQELEEIEMANHMDRARRQMNLDMNQPSKTPILFTLPVATDTIEDEIKNTLVTANVNDNQTNTNVNDTNVNDDIEDGGVEVEDDDNNITSDDNANVNDNIEDGGVEVEDDDNNTNANTNTDDCTNANVNDNIEDGGVEVEDEEKVEDAEDVIYDSNLDNSNADNNNLEVLINNAMNDKTNDDVTPVVSVTPVNTHTSVVDVTPVVSVTPVTTSTLSTPTIPKFEFNPPAPISKLYTTKPNIVFKTVMDDNPPVINALYKLSNSQRDKLYSDLFKKATNSVCSLIDPNIDEETKNKMIKKEADRLLNAYLTEKSRKVKL